MPEGMDAVKAVERPRNDRKTHLEIRTQLLKNGYVPLRNKRKQCLEKGWSTFMVTQEMINKWEPNPRSAKREFTTGVRCDGLACLDLDTEDPNLIEQLLAVMDKLGIEGGLERVGNPRRRGSADGGRNPGAQL